MATPELERRYIPATELRVVNERGQKKICGYAAKFNSDSLDLGGFIESIAPGAFKRSLAGGADVRALVDHDPSKILGRTKSGTLRLAEDANGLHCEITPPDTMAARDVMASIERGDIDGMSFGFTVPEGGDSWDYGQSPARRTLRDVDVFDVSAVTFPAYPDTSVALGR